MSKKPKRHVDVTALTNGMRPLFEQLLSRRSRPRALTAAQIQAEGQVLAMYLLCLHPDNYKELGNYPVFPGKPGGAFQHITLPGVYNSFAAAIADTTAAGVPHQTVLAAFRNGFQVISNAAQSLDTDPYDNDPNSCPSGDTLVNLQTKGLSNV